MHILQTPFHLISGIETTNCFFGTQIWPKKGKYLYKETENMSKIYLIKSFILVKNVHVKDLTTLKRQQKWHHWRQAGLAVNDARVCKGYKSEESRHPRPGCTLLKLGVNMQQKLYTFGAHLSQPPHPNVTFQDSVSVTPAAWGHKTPLGLVSTDKSLWTQHLLSTPPVGYWHNHPA